MKENLRIHVQVLGCLLLRPGHRVLDRVLDLALADNDEPGRPGSIKSPTCFASERDIPLDSCPLTPLTPPTTPPAAAVPSRSGRVGAAAGVRSLLAAALHGAYEYSYAGTQDCEVAEHLDDEHYPGCLGFRADVPETHR